MERRMVGKASTGDEAVYEEAASRIRAGRLVAFPTETVYGLGGDGLNVAAVKAIFEMKRRPASDPVILHVNEASEALKLWDVGPAELKIIEALQRAFWPGPVTIVAKAASEVPVEVTAHTGMVAVRSPSHPVARKLIDFCNCPIAAPSANLFSRVSPTSAAHVAKYFSGEDVLLLECTDACSVGIESAVVKVEAGGVSVLRASTTTAERLREALAAECGELRVQDKEIRPLTGTVTAQTPGAESPGQCLVHYAPKAPTYLVIGDEVAVRPKLPAPLAQSCVLDLSGRFPALRAGARLGLQLEDVNRELFAALHTCEDAGAAHIYICLSAADASAPHLRGVLDRAIRAAAHKVIS